MWDEEVQEIRNMLFTHPNKAGWRHHDNLINQWSSCNSS